MRIAPVTTPGASVTLDSESSSSRTIAAPTAPPQSVPMPPRTVMSTALPEVVQWRRSSEAKLLPIAYSDPARPAMPPDRTKAMSL